MRARSHLLLLISVLFLLITVTAQQRANASTAKFTAEEAAQSSTNSELAKQSREAAGEDDQEQFKHSGSVQFVSRITGLSLEHAYWLSVLLNFAIVAGVIVWVSKKNLPALFRDRTASIQKAMQEARKASEDANRRLSEIEARLSRLDVEIGQMAAAAEKEAAAEEERIKAAAEEDARKIVESADQRLTRCWCAILPMSFRQPRMDLVRNPTTVGNSAWHLSRTPTLVLSLTWFLISRLMLGWR